MRKKLNSRHSNATTFQSTSHQRGTHLWFGVLTFTEHTKRKHSQVKVKVRSSNQMRTYKLMENAYGGTKFETKEKNCAQNAWSRTLATILEKCVYQVDLILETGDEVRMPLPETVDKPRSAHFVVQGRTVAKLATKKKSGQWVPGVASSPSSQAAIRKLYRGTKKSFTAFLPTKRFARSKLPYDK